MDSQEQPQPETSDRFAGRGQAINQLSQHLADPARLGAIGFAGKPQSGKTRLLRHFQQSAPATDLMIYLDCDAQDWPSDLALIEAIATHCEVVVIEHGYLPGLSKKTTESQDKTWDWLRQDQLPTLYHAIRANRRLVLLLDNIHRLIDAIEDDRLSADLGTHLKSLLGSQLGLVYTFNLDDEGRIDKLAPLVTTSNLHRLTNLTYQDVHNLFIEAFPSRIMDEAIVAINRDSGGEPSIVSHIVEQLETTTTPGSPIDTEQIKTLIPALLDHFQMDFQSVWQGLTPDQQQVLTAIANLNYQSPVSAITASEIERWMIQTDFALDEVEIAATLRSLEYYEILALERGSAISFKTRLFQRWVLNHTNLDQPVARINPGEPASTGFSTSLWVMIAIIILLIFLGIVLLGGSDDADTPNNTIPTVTLAPDQ